MALEKVMEKDRTKTILNLTMGKNATHFPHLALQVAVPSLMQQQYNNHDKLPPTADTVVVVEMTKLDVSLSQLDTIRDKISFLVSEHRRRVMSKLNAQILQHKDYNSTNTNTTNLAKLKENKTMTMEQNDTNVEWQRTVMPLEVVVVLESSGGSAAEYALAAQQLQRLRNEPGITLTIVVDKVAASGE